MAEAAVEEADESVGEGSDGSVVGLRGPGAGCRRLGLRGWDGATDLETQQDVLNSKMFRCIYSLTGAVEGDIVKVHGLMLFSEGPDQGLPLTFEGNLKTGSLKVNAYDMFDFEGTGVVRPDLTTNKSWPPRRRDTI